MNCGVYATMPGTAGTLLVDKIAVSLRLARPSVFVAQLKQNFRDNLRFAPIPSWTERAVGG